MQLWYLGIDVAKAKLDCALRQPDGKHKHKVFDNNLTGFASLHGWLLQYGVTELHACMEATGVYWEDVAEYLANLGYVVSVVNPLQIKAFGASRLVRTKTDKVDAKLIAEFCKENRPEAWKAPSLQEQGFELFERIHRARCRSTTWLRRSKMTQIHTRPSQAWWWWRTATRIRSADRSHPHT